MQNNTTTPPNILLLMADQLAAPLLPFYATPENKSQIKTPHLNRLASESVVFDAAYCNFPICAPSRYSMLSGRMPHSIQAWDNATEFPSEIPTLAHYLGAADYQTILAGKMHFVGPDQLHGYDERLTTDIYPAEFLWVPDWSKGPNFKPTGVGMGHVVDAGPCVRNMQIDYDEEVESAAIQKIYDLARGPQDKPFFLTASFTHPHPPFVAPQEYWDLYDPEQIDMPTVPEIAYADLDPHSQWLYLAHGQDRHQITPERVRRARHAYYAMASYVDEKIGRVLNALDKAGLAENTVVIFCGDHGEMLGERGMWFKQTFYEWSARVPFTVKWPGQIQPGHRQAPCSLIDLLPTCLDIATRQQAPSSHAAPVEQLDGISLLPTLLDSSGQAENAERAVLSEYSSEGVCAPSRMLRKGDYKYIYTLGLPPLLFNLRSDPNELHNLAGSAEHQAVEQGLREKLLADWNPEDINARILASQKRRLFLRSLSIERKSFPDWTFEARQGDKQRFVRPSSALGAVGAKPRMRLPFVQPTPPDALQPGTVSDPSQASSRAAVTNP